MKLIRFACTTLMIGCGQNLAPSELVMVRTIPSDKSSTYSQSEEILGIKSKKGDQQGALKSLSKKKGGEPSKVDQAFGSYVQFVSPTTNSRCAGVFSYEPLSNDRTTVNVHFNTAVHCFEKINPLGLTEIPLSKGSIKLGTPALPPESFVRPYQVNNRVKRAISFTKAEVMFDQSGKPSDALRLLVGQLPLAQAEQLYLPSCDGYSSSAKDKALHAMGWSSTSDSPFVAAVRLEGLTGLPPFVMQQFALGGEASQLFELSGVSLFPGESGGSVYQVDGREDVDRVNRYECVHGVISREVIEPILQASPLTPAGSNTFTLKVNSYFTPITARALGASWRELK